MRFFLLEMGRSYASFNGNFPECEGLHVYRPMNNRCEFFKTYHCNEARLGVGRVL